MSEKSCKCLQTVCKHNTPTAICYASHKEHLNVRLPQQCVVLATIGGQGTLAETATLSGLITAGFSRSGS